MDAFPQSFRSSPLIYPSLAQGVVNSLAIAIDTLGLGPVDTQPLISIEPSPKIGCYRSAIALTFPHTDKTILAKELGAIAQAYLNDTLYSSSGVQTAVITSQSTGWLEIQYALDLQREVINDLTTHSILAPQPLTAISSHGLSHDLLFELQYAHARCSSQLKLAQAIAPSLSPFLPPAIAPWLVNYFNLYSTQDSIEQQLWQHLLNFPNELQPHKRLIATVNPQLETFATNDAFLTQTLLETPISLQRLRTVSQTWTILFQKFYAQSRLFEIMQPEHQNLRTLRLSLFSGLRTVLQFILTELLHMSAPSML